MTPFEKLTMMVGIGAVVAIALLALSTPNVLRRLGWIHFPSLNGWRPFSPNWLTVWGTLVTLVGFAAYAHGEIFSGFSVVVAGAVMDRLDGKMAKALGRTLEMDVPWWNQMNFPGFTDLGKNMDPLADKIRFLPLVTFAAIETDFIHPALIVAMWALEIFSTCMRPPFRFLDRWVGGRGATSFGKLKVATQWLTLILWTPFHQGWLQENVVAVNLAMELAVFCGTVSVLSRLKPIRRHRRVAQVIDRTDREFRH